MVRPPPRALRAALLGLIVGALTGCAVLHRSAIGERQAPADAAAQPIAVDVSEFGIHTEGVGRSAAAVARGAGRAAGSGRLKALGRGLELVTWATTQSPRTGNATWDDLWADDIGRQLRERCPGGVVTGIQTTRESASYPYVSGEIVRVRAFCEKN